MDELGTLRRTCVLADERTYSYDNGTFHTPLLGWRRGVVVSGVRQ